MQKRFAIVAFLAASIAGGVGAQDSSPISVTLYLDVSGSMQGARANAMKEAAKLAMAVLPDSTRLVVVPFSDRASSKAFSLVAEASRTQAQQFINDLRVDGGTDYLQALKVAPLPKDAVGIFLSDGEHQGDSSGVIQHLKANDHGRLFTIAVEPTSPKDDALLAQMAAITKGSHVRVEKTEDLVRTFLAISQQLGNYSACRPQQAKVDLANVKGPVIVFGFDAQPALSVGSQNQAAKRVHYAKLPGEHVEMRKYDLADPSNITIQAQNTRSVNGRLGLIFRQDLPKAEMRVEASAGKALAGGDVRVETRFTDGDGMPIDPRSRPDLSSWVEAVDASGKIVDKANSKPSSTTPALEAVIRLPKSAGPVTIRGHSAAKAGGESFEQSDSRTILAVAPQAWTIQPNKLAWSQKVGSHIEIVKSAGSSAVTQVTARFEGSGAKLQDIRQKAETLELCFVADRPGEILGEIVLDGTSNSGPLATLRLPVQAKVLPRHGGLELAREQMLRVGPKLANSGSVQLAALELRTADEDAMEYFVEIEDLACSGTLLRVTASESRIPVSKANVGKPQLQVEVGNVPTGTYRGAVVLRAKDRSLGEWRTELELAVTEPLSIGAVNVGQIAPGQKVDVNVAIKNLAGAISNIDLTPPSFSRLGQKAVCVLPKPKFALEARQALEIPLQIALAPTVKERGEVLEEILVRRVTGQVVRAPVRMEIVDPSALRSLIVSPTKLEMEAKPGEPIRFQVRVRLKADANPDRDNLNADFGLFREKDGKDVSIKTASRWEDTNMATVQQPASLAGFLVAPNQRGTFVGSLILRGSTGETTIPITLIVK